MWYRRRRDSPGSLALNLKRDLVEAGSAQDIQQMNDIAVDRPAIAHRLPGVFTDPEFYDPQRFSPRSGIR